MFELSGEKELLQFALDVGLGDRNSQGYGMVEVIKL
jgi:CRISPR-associated endoribonuclease Cas6